MGRAYIKTWDELYQSSSICVDSENPNMLIYKNEAGYYNKNTHGTYGGQIICYDSIDEEKWIRTGGYWFAPWTYSNQQDNEHSSSDTRISDYEAFLIWGSDIEKRKQEIYNRIKDIQNSPKRFKR